MGTEDTNTDANDWIWASTAATELANAQGLENYLAEAARAKRIFRELCIAINNTELNVYPPGVTGTRVERPARSSEPEFPTDDYPIKRTSLEAWWQSKQPSFAVAQADAPASVEKETSSSPDSAPEARSKVENEKTKPTPLTSKDIAHALAGLGWTEEKWMKPLGDKPKWLRGCIAFPGQQGVSQTRWNPVLVGAALVRMGRAKQNSVRARFQTKPVLKPWFDEWKTYEADYLDIDLNGAKTPRANPGKMR